MEKQKISVTIITLNEEENIRDCLKSVKWADEIIVSDSGSTDATREICGEFGAKVFTDEWHGFGKQKNLCEERASGQWILNLDADERVSSELASEICSTVEKKAYDGYYIARKNYFGSRWIKRCGWYPDYNLRLYRKGASRFAEIKVHEAVILKANKGYLKNHIEHFTYRSISDYLKRMDRYSTLAAEQLYSDGKKATPFDVFLRPQFTFFKMYVLRLGFLEGVHGLILSLLYSFYTMAKYAKLWEMNHARD
jgi:glycosyltransferase involved in cell wall biosynthesis